MEPIVYYGVTSLQVAQIVVFPGNTPIRPMGCSDGATLMGWIEGLFELREVAVHAAKNVEWDCN